jgi:hypothetical protein
MWRGCGGGVVGMCGGNYQHSASTNPPGIRCIIGYTTLALSECGVVLRSRNPKRSNACGRVERKEEEGGMSGLSGSPASVILNC